ncbi:ABC transporter permease [Candidatus Saccharibacteria bacterium]|nr:ABC transporter permease [Candidatus Saccharibacteria bacterium]
MKRYIQIILALAKAYRLRFFRDKTALFFTFLFPLLFLFVFGSLNSSNSDISFKVALFNRSDSSFAKDFVNKSQSDKTLKVNKDVTDFNTARELMGRGEIDSIIELPKEFGVPNNNGVPSGKMIVYYQEASPQSGKTIAAVMEGVLDGINKSLGQPEPPLGVTQKSTATSNLSPFDYVFSGLLGFTLLSLGIFGLANSMPAEKKTGAFKRLRASPITAAQLIFANMLHYLLIGLISVVLMIAVALLVFDFNMRGDWLTLATFVIIGIILMFGFGLAIGGWAKNENQSAALSNIISFPMMFLSGTFFPRFLMPSWLQDITAFLPLTPIIDGMRQIITESKTLFDLGPELGLIGIWIVIIYFIAIRVFRWE